MQVDKHIIDQINDLHKGVIDSSKSAIEYAIKAGAELSRIKEMCQHGEFLLIINNSFKFSDRTAQNYMKCYEYSAKTQTLADLQQAYKLIESEEAKKKQALAVEQNKKFEYRRKYNEKPDNWQRADDYAWAKVEQARKQTDERINTIFEQKKAETTVTQNLKDELNDTSNLFGDLKNYLHQEIAKQEQLAELNIVNQNGGILDVIANYLAGLTTDEQRMEECHNIIKYCKNVSAKLQSKS
jgi:hypothetical protein